MSMKLSQMVHAAKVAEGLGIDAENQMEGIMQAWHRAAIGHALESGDGPCKPVDYDFYYPKDDQALEKALRVQFSLPAPK